jgi:hypothetical protein
MCHKVASVPKNLLFLVIQIVLLMLFNKVQTMNFYSECPEFSF